MLGYVHCLTIKDTQTRKVTFAHYLKIIPNSKSDNNYEINLKYVPSVSCERDFSWGSNY